MRIIPCLFIIYIFTQSTFYNCIRSRNIGAFIYLHETERRTQTDFYNKIRLKMKFRGIAINSLAGIKGGKATMSTNCLN